MTLDQGIATVLSSAITTVGALSAVLLGWLFFSGKVKDLKGAIDNSEYLLRQHEASITEKLSQISDKVEQVDSLFKSKLAGFGKIESAVDDLQKAGANLPQGTFQSDALDALKQDWLSIRDMLENVAAAANDGRTRAKYARIDRRRYQDLIDVLDRDGRVGSLRSSFDKALELWNRYRSGRSVPNTEDVELMNKLKKNINSLSDCL